MAIAGFGRVHGKTIELDGDMPELEGARVHVVVEKVSEQPREPIVIVIPESERDLWQEWIDHGPQGPLEDDLDTESP